MGVCILYKCTNFTIMYLVYIHLWIDCCSVGKEEKKTVTEREVELQRVWSGIKLFYTVLSGIPPY